MNGHDESLTSRPERRNRLPTSSANHLFSSLSRRLMVSLWAVLWCLAAQDSGVSGSEFPAAADKSDVARLMKSTAYLRSLSERDAIQLVPQQSGLRYVGCPNCSAGNQENQLKWDPSHPDTVYCQYCGHRYPDERYPTNGSVTVRNPLGEPVSFPYWADQEGYRHFFTARRDDEVKAYLADRIRDLSLLYQVTGEWSHARRAAVLLDRFAQVFPGWCYHFDYPFQQKQIYDGNVLPDQFRPGYRTARWTWWAYSDIPVPLLEAYDWIRDSGIFAELSREQGIDTAMRLERDLFRNAAEQVLANPEPLTNKSPAAWRSIVIAGRILREPRYIHEVVRRFRRLMESRFFYDGAWCEGSPNYGSATVESLAGVLAVLEGYRDPPGYADAEDGSHYNPLNIDAEFPSLDVARAAIMKMRLPDGRLVPVHDTWSTKRQSGPLPSTEPWLLPALGHACLGGGVNDRQIQFHLMWSGGYGHSHADNLSILLYGHGHEVCSDLGYTHTAWRSWTLATAAHNTVVIDGCNQGFGGLKTPTDGRLLFCDIRNPGVQTVCAEGTRGYPALASKYTRTLVQVEAAEGNRYCVDVFEVEGGQTHDYFLHGNADHPTEATTSLKMKPLDSLLPTGFAWTPTRNEGEAGRVAAPWYAYGFLKNLMSTDFRAGTTIPVEFKTIDSGAGLRMFCFPDFDGQIVLGDNPAIRPAEENDARLEAFNRPFMMIRHEAAEGNSVFVSVLEPFEKTSPLRDVRRIQVDGEACALQIVTSDRTDLIVINARETTRIPIGTQSADFRGEVGVLSLRGESVDSAYAIGDGGWTFRDFQLPSPPPGSSRLQSVADGALIIDADAAELLQPGDILRLVTADGWVYPFTLASVELQGQTTRLQVVEGPGMAFDRDEKILRLTSFPQREHSGEVRVEWMPSVIRQIDRHDSEKRCE